MADTTYFADSNRNKSPASARPMSSWDKSLSTRENLQRRLEESMKPDSRRWDHSLSSEGNFDRMLKSYDSGYVTRKEREAGEALNKARAKELVEEIRSYKDPLHQLAPYDYPERDWTGKVKQVPRQARPQSYFQDIRMARLGPRKGAPEKLGISYEDYQNKLHPELGGEDWGANEPEGGFATDTWKRLVADTIAQKKAKDEHFERPLTQQEEAMGEWERGVLAPLRRDYNSRWESPDGYNSAYEAAYPGSGPPLTIEDVAQGAYTAATFSPWWKAVSLGKVGVDVLTGEEPSVIDAVLATVGYGGKTKMGKKAIDKIKSGWQAAPKKKIITGATAAALPSSTQLGGQSARGGKNAMSKESWITRQRKKGPDPGAKIRKYFIRGLGG